MERPGTPEERDEGAATTARHENAARTIQGFAKKSQSRSQLKLLLKSIVVRKVDDDSGEVYYLNTRNGQRTATKPILLGADEIEGEPWTCARCGKFNGTGPVKCVTCSKRRNDSEADDRKAKGKSRDEEAVQRRDMEAQQAEARAQARLRRLDAEDQQIPDAPQGVGSQVGDTEAGVWWTPGADNGKEVTQFKVYRYRLDGTDWIKRGESVYGPDKVRACFVVVCVCTVVCVCVYVQGRPSLPSREGSSGARRTKG